ncbi:MAG: PQQ-binding-like beta-propeller repeat protein [Spirochaetales bacterium]|nr:PQQ-binding-like beta-propeller repeat protein [Spirochaetales bacterium]
MPERNNRFISGISACLTLAAGSLIIAAWLSFEPAFGIVKHVPGMDSGPTVAEAADETVDIGSNFRKTGEAVSFHPGSWPRFRGEDFDNISKETIPLADKWPEKGPPVLWSVSLGEGHSGPAVGGGRVYILDYDEASRSDALRCLSLADGNELWRRWYRVLVKRNHGMSRTIPAIADGVVVTIGPRCHVMCVDDESGDFLWGIDLEKEYGTEVPMWYTAQCPLIDNGVAVIAPGGKSLLIGVDCRTGNILWETPNPDGWHMSHSSIMPMSISGVDMYLYSSPEGLTAVGARGEETGKVLWRTKATENAVIAPSPVVLPGGRIFVTAGYGAGSILLEVTKKGTGYETEVLESYTPRQYLASEQQTPIFFRNHLFGILPKDAGNDRTQFVCYDPEGGMVFKSGREHQFGLGPYIIADGKFYILRDDGVLFMIRALTERYEELDAAKLLDGRDAWGPLAIAGGLLLLRDSKRLICIDVRE